MAVNKVELTVSQLINDLNSGLTWFKKDDLGYGSIETKYGANPTQIAAIKKHPSLKDAETSITIFNIIDDTKDAKPATNTTKSNATTDRVVEQPTMALESSESEVDAFANL